MKYASTIGFLQIGAAVQTCLNFDCRDSGRAAATKMRRGRTIIRIIDHNISRNSVLNIISETLIA
jgi:hypothetical protein